MVFGVLKATAGSTDWEAVSTGNKIQVFAQILYGYGYWGPFALEYETSRVDCGLSDLERTLYEYGYVTDYNRSDLDPTIGKYFTSELNSAIKEKDEYFQLSLPPYQGCYQITWNREYEKTKTDKTVLL